jgi:hypothetical protein
VLLNDPPTARKAAPKRELMIVIDESPAKSENVLSRGAASPTLSTMPIKSEPSLVPGILMSDVSIVEVGSNKRSVVGCFDQFVFPQFPAAYGRFFVTAWISNLVGTLSEVELTCRVEQKGSGHVVFSNSIHLNFPGEQTFEAVTILATSIPVQGVVFQQPGTYTIALLLNGENVGHRDFAVSLPPPPQQPPQPST